MKDCGSVLIDGIEDRKKKKKKNRNLLTAHVRKSVYRIILICFVLSETQGKKVPVLMITVAILLVFELSVCVCMNTLVLGTCGAKGWFCRKKRRP